MLQINRPSLPIHLKEGCSSNFSEDVLNEAGFKDMPFPVASELNIRKSSCGKVHKST